jgi:hypothetical protein
VGNPVDFYLGTNKMGTVVDPPYLFTVTNVPAGEYKVQVGTTNASGVYTLDPGDGKLYVIEPTFQNPSRPDSRSFAFDFGGTVLSTNITERSSDLRTWIPLATNVTITNAFSYRDTNAVDALRFYRMKIFTVLDLLP